jgi:phospholipid/cholesterol/gamma-HCH transport system substrate-binding protein
MANERIMKFRLGIVVVATGLVAVTLVLLFGRVPAIFKSSYPIYVKFKDASGISPGTPVTKFGIRIGQVTEIGFADDGKSALVTLAIDSNIRLTSKETFSINKSMFGDAVIEVVREEGALSRRASVLLAHEPTRRSSPLIKVPQASTLTPRSRLIPARLAP